MRLDYKKIQDQNKELSKRNLKLSSTLDALRKERELLVFERDRLKQDKREGYTRFTQKVTDFSEETNSNNSKEDSEVVTNLQQQLAARDQEIKSLQLKVFQNDAKETADTKSKSSKEEEEEGEEPVGSAQHKLTLNKLIEEQTISSNLRNNNSELKLRVATLETEIEKLHLQNSHNLQLVEQANAAAQAATNLVTANPKQKKKSIFGIRRSGRKKTSMDSPPVKRGATGTKKTLSNSQPSLDGSLSEHDIHSLLTKRHETPPVAIPYNPFNKPPDAQLLQTSVKLAMEEKTEVERQLACLREELNALQDRIEELVQENSNKERIYVDAVQEIERLRQALQLTTREKELLASETESLCFQNESLRAEKGALRGKEVKAVLKEKQEMEFLRSENKALMSEIRTLIVNSDGLETSLSQLKREKVAKDVRDHEIKLKLKKTEQENSSLKTELKQLKSKEVNDLERAGAEAKSSHQSPKITVSMNSESSPREKHSPSTGQQQSQRTPEKRHIGLPVYIDEFPLKSRVLHERAQSEDFTSQQAYMKSKTIPMQRTSSGGTKVLAVQSTLPTKETPLKVADKSLLFTSDSHGLKLGSFQPLSPKSSGVNSLVKMFETGKPKDEELIDNIKDTVVPTENEAPSQTPSSSSSRETTPARRSSTNAKDKTPTRERKLSSSNSPGRRNSKCKEGEEVETKQVSRNSERKKSSSSRSTSPSLRKTSITTSGSDIKGNTHDSSKNTKSVSNSSLKGTTSKTSYQSREKSPTKERKNSGGTSVRKFSHGSSEAKYLPKKDDLHLKDQSHRRTASLVISKEQKQRVSPEKTEHPPSERVVSPRSSTTQKVHESPDVSKLNTITEKTKSGNEDGTKLTVSKHVSRISVTVEDKIPDDSNNAKSKSPMSPEKSQTWPTKTSSEIRKVEPSNNTLPLTSKGGEVSEKKSTSPTQLTPLSISKPKPPPTALLKSSSMPRNTANSPAPPLDETPAGIVQNLRSSWEKKSHNSPLKPITKTGSASTLSSSNELSGSYSQSPVNSPVRPITKTGSGPPGVILHSPSIKKPSPPPSTSAAPLSPTTKFTRLFHSPLVKMESSPLNSNLPGSTPSTPSTAQSTSINSNPAPHQNGISPMSYNKGSVSKRISSFEPSEKEVEFRRHSPTANGTSISPRLHRRPASLYVSSPSGHNAEGKQLSSLISILQEKTSCSPPPPVENKVNNVQPKKKFEQ